MKCKSLVLVYLLYCIHCSAVRDLRHSGHQIWDRMPGGESYAVRCSLLPPSFDSSCRIHRAMMAEEKNIEVTFAAEMRKAVDRVKKGEQIFNTAMHEAHIYTTRIIEAVNETATSVVSNEGGDACSSVFDDALAISHDFAAIFVEVLDQASDRISFIQPCDAITAIANESLSTFSYVLARVCHSKESQLDLLIKSLSSALTASHMEVINVALGLALSGAPKGQLIVRKTSTHLEGQFTVLSSQECRDGCAVIAPRLRRANGSTKHRLVAS